MEKRKLIIFWDDRLEELAESTLRWLAYLSLSLIPLPLVLFILYLLTQGASPEEFGIVILVGGFLVLLGFVIYWLFWKIVRIIARYKGDTNTHER